MEIQVFPNGNISTPSYAFEERNSAEQKYHNILASAAVSKLAIHSAIMVTEEGYYIKSESFKHEVESSEE